MTDEQLKCTLIEVRDYMLKQFPEDGDHEFSAHFRKKIKQLIEMEKHPVLYYAKMVAAILVITLGISGGLVLGFNKEVRADVIRWFVEHFAENGYRYQKEYKTEEDISQYSLKGIVTNKYQLIERTEKEEVINEVYLGEDGDILVFVVMSSTCEEELNVSSDKSVTKETVYVNGCKADLYLSDNLDESNIIAWEGGNGVLFSIGGILDKEQLISLAEKVK